MTLSVYTAWVKRQSLVYENLRVSTKKLPKGGLSALAGLPKLFLSFIYRHFINSLTFAHSATLLHRGLSFALLGNFWDDQMRDSMYVISPTHKWTGHLYYNASTSTHLKCILQIDSRLYGWRKNVWRRNDMLPETDQIKSDVDSS